MKKPGFEASVGRLEEIVRQLETGSAPLEDSLKLFEEGTALLRHCGTLLDRAEAKVSLLMKGADGEAAAQPFETEPEG